jgi:hypothetical protein
MTIESRRYPGESRDEQTQRIVDAFYTQHGPCCAGCDWWGRANSVAGECRKSAPVSGAERIAMLGMTCTSLPLAAGHIMTLREHHCGDFKDVFDWAILPHLYLKRIGRNVTTGEKA